MKRLEISSRLLARNTLLNFFGQVVPLLVGVVTIPFIVRGLGTERFGLLSLAWVVLGYATIFDLGLGRAITKYVAEALGKGNEEQIPSLIWTAVTIQGLFGLLGTLLLFSITPFLVERVLNIPPELVSEAKAMFYLLALAVPVVLVSTSFSGVLEAAQRFDLVNAIKVLSGLVTFIIPLVGVLLGEGLSVITGIIVAFKLATLIIYLILNHKVFPELKWAISYQWNLAPTLMTYSGWVAVAGVMSMLLDRIDRFFIGSLLSVTDVTYYSLPQEILGRLWVIPYSLTMVLFPAFSTLQSLKEGVSAPYVKSLRYIAATTLPLTCGAILFSHELLNLWLGNPFAERSAIVAQVLAAGSLIAILAPVPATALQSLNRPDLVSKNLAAQFLYPLILWLAIDEGGLVGAAVALAARAIIQALILLWLANKQVQINNQQGVQLRLLLAFLFSSMLLSLIFANLDYVALRVTFWLIITVLCLGFVFKQVEIRLILRMLTRRSEGGA